MSGTQPPKSESVSEAAEQPQPQPQLLSQPDAPTQLHISDNRLSTPPQYRIMTGIIISSVLGGTMGMSHGAQETALRFRAENSHRLPTSTRGWYLYHKSKNYAVALGGTTEARRMGVRLGFWTGVFLVLEDMFDVVRGARSTAWEMERLGALRDQGFSQHEVEALAVGGQDLGSTMGAGLVTAGAFSVWHRVPSATAVRMVRLGLTAGFIYGGLQDGVRLLRGRPVGYVEWAKGMLGVGDRDKEPV